MLCITVKVLWELWIYLTISLRNGNTNLQVLWCSSACKKRTPSLVSFLNYCKNIANLILWVIWECLTMHMINHKITLQEDIANLPFWKLWGNFHVYLFVKKSTSSLTSFLRYCNKIANFIILGNLGMPANTHKITVSIWKKIICR